MGKNKAGISPLASTEWLADNLDNPDVQIIDVRWKFREEDGKGVAFDDRDGYLATHIPGAVYVSMINDLSDKDHPVSGMMVDAKKFAEVMSRLGIRNDAHLIIYDDSGLPLASARLWWAFNLYGHEHVQVLDGGLLQWQLEGRETSSKVPDISPSKFTTVLREQWLAHKEDVVEAMDDPHTTIIDCLPNEQYRGSDVHAWGDRAGHVPGAINIPAISNFNPEYELTTMAERGQLLAERGSFKLGSAEDLAAFYTQKGIRPDGKAITYCGRGIAASCGLLTLKHLGVENASLYDGSWSEWSADEALPIEKS